MDAARWLAVKFYTQTEVVSGLIYQYEEERLLDLLNGVSLRRRGNQGKFLALSDVTIQQVAAKKEERLPTAYINRATIQLATTPEGDLARGIGAKAGHKPYPFVEKLSVPVRLHTPAYAVTGRMHQARGQRVWHVLEERPTFLPLTTAEIRALANGISSQVAFVAVNREQIVSLQEEELPLVEALRSQPERTQ